MTDQPEPTRREDELAALRQRNAELESHLLGCGCLPAPATGEKPPTSAGPADPAERSRPAHPLSAVVAELSRADSFDALCQGAVELGHRRLGFERLSLWFTTDRSWEIEGSFGIDEFSAEKEPERSRATEQAGERLGRADRRYEVDVDLGLPEPGVMACETHVGVQRHLESAANCNAGDRSEDRLR